MSKISNNLTYLRSLKRKTQQLVSDEMGIAQSTYGTYEQSKCEPSIPMLIKLSYYYKVPIDVLCRTDLRVIGGPYGADLRRWHRKFIVIGNTNTNPPKNGA